MKKIILAAALAVALSADAYAQSDTLSGSDTMELTVYATKFAENSKRIAQTVRVIKDRPLLNFQPNTGDILINTGSVFVQKSQQGGSSPVIRGFEASRVLLMVDGIRMNNAIYRAGHLQNVITVDNAILDRMEILYGPSSTLYGSDALGGVVSMFTKNPSLSRSKETEITGNGIFRYATAIEEARAHLDFNIGGKQWASLTSITYGSFGDMRQGKKRRDKYPNFGLQPFIVRRVGNTDSAFANPDPNKQTPSGYNQVDIMQKILFQPKSNIQHILNLQFSNSTNVPRYDRLTEAGSGNPVWAEWYYGPQIRNMVGYHFNASQLQGFFKELKVVANYQDIEESRIQRRFKNNNKDFRWERVNIYGISADAKRYSGKHEIQMGLESYVNHVRSTAERMNIVSGAKSKITTRYSDGPTKMTWNAAYVQHTLKFNQNWTLNDGVRINAVKLDAVFADTSLMHFPFTRATQNNLAVTGNLGLIYANQHNIKIAFLLSSGFRSPNIDDLTKVFDTRVGMVVVPNTELKPEYTYNAEINFTRSGKMFGFGGSVFYTLFRNALVVDRFQFNGQDSIIYTGVKSAVFAVQNKARAYIYGFSANASVTVFDHTAIDGVFTYTHGRYKGLGGEVPLDHIPPTYGRVAIKHTKTKWLAEVYTLFNGWKKLKDYSPSGEDNLIYATPDGMPSWFTLNTRAVLTLSKNLQAQLLVENVLDRNYRYFASGISAPGRNAVLSLKAGF